jgi:beta-N-acetylhexosaminidase
MLLPCNLESGGNGLATTGTFFGKEMEIAATSETEQARRFGYICGKEGGSVGCNWTFSPIVDIDYNWRNPITNVRTFGADPDVVIEMSKAFLQGVKDSGTDMAVCIKHFPGDGVDERDQHLLSSVNSLSCQEWENTYGRVYRTLIEAGAQTVMVGHILQPEMTRKMCPGIRDEDILPGSTNRYLMTDLLRGELGFNGLISTDATPMVGFTGTLTRQEALCTALMAGADVILFCKNMDEDYDSIRQGLENGQVTMERLNEAVARQLALKASLHLPEKQKDGTIVPQPQALEALGAPVHQAWARECADKAITLVKDNQNLLPISPSKTPRIRLTVLGERESGTFGDNGTIGGLLKEELEKAGFQVSLYDYETLEHGEIFTSGVADLKKKFDLSMVAANVPTGSNNTSRRVDWVTLMAADEPWYTREIPTMFISFCNPYHMVDVPFISTFVNCYSSNPACVEEAVRKLTGQSPFRGKSPVDPWCGGIWGAKFM